MNAQTKLRPEEIARAALFILQDDYYNGRILEIDGGYGFNKTLPITRPKSGWKDRDEVKNALHLLIEAWRN